MPNFEMKLRITAKKLTSIVDTVILYGCGGMALKGHGDDSQYHQKIGGYSTTHVVNFIDMLKLRIKPFAGTKFTC